MKPNISLLSYGEGAVITSNWWFLFALNADPAPRRVST